ncbi:MAG: GNAT family N-acetyltransferase [bacterium]
MAALAREDAHFDIEGRGGDMEALEASRAEDFLADPSVLFWVAEEGVQVVGFLFCHILKMRAGVGQEILLYEIGVRRKNRRQSVGRALQKTVEAWMRKKGIAEIWVLADNPGALEFYKDCGFEGNEGMAVYLTKRVEN